MSEFNLNFYANSMPIANAAKMRSLKTRVNELQAIVESIKKSGGLNSAQPRVVLVGGPPASGKSVLAKEIGRQMGVQVVTGNGDIMKNASQLGHQRSLCEKPFMMVDVFGSFSPVVCP